MSLESRLDDALGPLPDADEFNPPVWWDIAIQCPVGTKHWEAAKSVLQQHGIDVRKVATVYMDLNVPEPPYGYRQEEMEIFASIPESFTGERLVGSYEGDDIIVYIVEMAH